MGKSSNNEIQNKPCLFKLPYPVIVYPLVYPLDLLSDLHHHHPPDGRQARRYNPAGVSSIVSQLCIFPLGNLKGGN